MFKVEKIYLTECDARTLREYCKGCIFFRPDIRTRDICSVISWYDNKAKNNMAQIVSYVKNCPCTKCLVKASCKESQCPMWLNYVQNLADKRMTMVRKRFSKKNSRAINA